MRDADVDVIVVGAGFAGLYALHRLRGMGLTVRVFEAGGGVGGTWYWNRYPGCRCDIESLDYQYSFSEELLREWQWTERYPSQPEILRYLEHVAERFDLNRDITLNTRVTEATLDEESGLWTVSTDTGVELTGRFCVMATGCLSVPKGPEVPGSETFAGATYHTGRWPHEGVDFTGTRVAVIGTGSSGIQSIPIIAEQARHVTVFQRTPNFTAPAWNGPLDAEEARAVIERYEERRRRLRESFTSLAYPENDKGALELTAEEREREMEARYRAGGLYMVGVFADAVIDPEANEHVAEFFRRKIRELVDDPALAETLSPRTYPWGTKRPCVDTGYYETFNRTNVSLVDLRREPLEEIVATGVRTSERTYEADVIVFATGFDAMTGALKAIDIRGRDGVLLRDVWSEGPRTYLGIGLAGFPNLFLITGPGSPSVFSNMVVSIEQHVEWIAGAIEHMRTAGVRTIEPTREAQEAWVQHVAEVGDFTLLKRGNSWWIGANVPGKPRLVMPYLGGVGAYRQRCDEIAAAGYEGFALA